MCTFKADTVQCFAASLSEQANGRLTDARLGDNWLGRGTCEKEPRVLAGHKLNMSRECDIGGKKANAILGCMNRNLSSVQIEESSGTILSCYTHLEYSIQFWALQFKEDLSKLECVHSGMTTMSNDLETKDGCGRWACLT